MMNGRCLNVVALFTINLFTSCSSHSKGYAAGPSNERRIKKEPKHKKRKQQIDINQQNIGEKREDKKAMEKKRAKNKVLPGIEPGLLEIKIKRDQNPMS